MTNALTILGLVILLALTSGCSAQPDILTEMRQPQPKIQNLSDATVVSYWSKVAEKYGADIRLDSVLSTGGKLTLAALSTATLAVAARGGGVTAFAAAGNALLSWLGIIQPKERAVTYGIARGRLRDALGAYIVARAGNPITVPNTCVSTAGAALFAATLDTETRAEQVIIGMLPDDPKPDLASRGFAAAGGC